MSLFSPFRLVTLTAAGLGAFSLLGVRAWAEQTNTDSLEVLLAAAESHHRKGRFEEAHSALAGAERTIGSRSGRDAERARIWTTRGNIYLSQITAANRGYAEADSAAVQAIAFAKLAGDDGLLADAHDLTGRVLYSRRINLGAEGYDEPLGHFQRALELRRKANNTRGIVESLFRVGLIHERKSEGMQAVTLYDEAMRLAGRSYPLERSNLARHLAYQNQRQGNRARAMELFRQSLSLREEAGFELNRSPALNSIGDLYREMKDYGKALEYGRRALAEAERLGATRFEVMALISLGDTHSALSQLEKATEHLRRAEARAGEIGYTSGLENARERLAVLRGGEEARSR
jgi:tetratricopeptide (TPR) repeat protein